MPIESTDHRPMIRRTEITDAVQAFATLRLKHPIPWRVATSELDYSPIVVRDANGAVICAGTAELCACVAALPDILAVELSPFRIERSGF